MALMDSQHPDAVSALEHDHEHLNRLVAHLRESVQQCLRGESEPEELQEQLSDFIGLAQEELVEHFDKEETGLFPFIAEAFDDQADVVEKLERAHDRMCGVLLRLERLVEQPTEVFAEHLDAAVALFARFDANFVQHARDERHLLNSLSERLTAEQRKTIDRMLAEL